MPPYAGNRLEEEIPAVVEVNIAFSVQIIESFIKGIYPELGDLIVLIDIAHMADSVGGIVANKVLISVKVRLLLALVKDIELTVGGALNIKLHYIGALAQGYLKRRESVAGNVTTGYTAVRGKKNTLWRGFFDFIKSTHNNLQNFKFIA